MIMKYAQSGINSDWLGALISCEEVGQSFFFGREKRSSSLKLSARRNISTKKEMRISYHKSHFRQG